MDTFLGKRGYVFPKMEERRQVSTTSHLLPQPWALTPSKVKNRLAILQTLRSFHLCVFGQAILGASHSLPLRQTNSKSRQDAAQILLLHLMNPIAQAPYSPSPSRWDFFTFPLCTKERTRVWRGLGSAPAQWTPQLGPSLQLCTHTAHMHTSYKTQHCHYAGELKIQTA